MHSISVYSQFLAKVHWHQWLFNEIWWRNTWTYRQTTDTQIWGYLEHLNVVRNQKVDPFLLIDFMISWFWRKESTEWVRMKILILRTSRKTSFAWSSVVVGGGGGGGGGGGVRETRCWNWNLCPVVLKYSVKLDFMSDRLLNSVIIHFIA